MTTTETVPYSGGQVVQGEVIRPTAFASPKETAVHDLGQVLIQLIHGATHAFTDENAKNAAITVVNKWAHAHVTASARRALMTGEEIAPVEDVTQRIPPPQVTFGTPANQGPGIDYKKLAAEIVRQQMAAAEAAKRDQEDDENYPETTAVEGGQTGDESDDDTPPPAKGVKTYPSKAGAKK